MQITAYLLSVGKIEFWDSHGFLSWECRRHVGRHVIPSLYVTFFWTIADMLLTPWLGDNLSHVLVYFTIWHLQS